MVTGNIEKPPLPKLVNPTHPSQLRMGVNRQPKLIRKSLRHITQEIQLRSSNLLQI